MKKTILLINLLLIYFSIDFCVAGLFDLIAGSGVAPLSAPLGDGVQDREKSRIEQESHYEIIWKRDLFKTEKSHPVYTKPPPSKKQVMAPPLKETDLQLDLIGTITGAGTRSRAVITRKDSVDQRLLQQGDKIDGAVIKTILRNRVILVVGGRDQVLWMKKPLSGTRGKTGPGLPDPVAKKIPAAFGLQDGFLKTVNLTWGQVQAMAQNAANYRKLLDIRPHFYKNQFDGFRVFGIKQDSVFERMGLKNGDIVSSLNNRKIQSEKDALGFYKGFKSLGGNTMVDLGIKRKGKTGTIKYAID